MREYRIIIAKIIAKNLTKYSKHEKLFTYQ